MSLLDRLRARPKPPADQAPAGGSGRAHYQGFLQLEELNQDLRHPLGHEVYDRMWRTDADVRRSMAMALNPILGATFAVEPFGGDDATDQAQADADFVRWALFENMRPNLPGHLSEFLPVLFRSGFAPGEKLWEAADYEGQQALVPRKIGLRLPRTIQRFEQDEFEELLRLWQLVPNKVTGPSSFGSPSSFYQGLIPLDAADLLYYRVGAEGDNWEGVSLLRPVFKHWFIKDQLEKIDAMGQEREAMGIPICYPPSGASKAQLDAAELVLGSIRAGEQGYILAPGPHAQDLMDELKATGWRFDVLGFSGGDSGAGRSAHESLTYHKDAIAMVFLAEFMRLGQKNVGSRALGETQDDPFVAMLEAIAETIVLPVLNDGLVVPLMAYNRPVSDGLPQLTMALTDQTSLKDLKDYVQALVTAGALHPDDEMEDYLRERADLPPADPKARAERQAQEQQDRELAVKGQQKALTEPAQPGPGDKPTKSTKSTASSESVTFARQQRPLTSWEEQMCLDDVENALDEARGRFEQAGQDQVIQLARAMAAKPGAAATIKPPPELTAALSDELTNLYAMGRATVAHELDRQRPSPNGGGVQGYAATFASQNGPGTLAARAALAARAIVRRMAEALGRLHVTGQHDQATLQHAAETAGRQGLRAEAQLNAGAVLGEGRSDEADQHADEIVGARYTSVLDGNTCPPCVHSDDGVLRPLTDPVRLARKPPNPMCEGGDRCRCLEFFQLAGESSPSA